MLETELRKANTLGLESETLLLLKGKEYSVGLGCESDNQVYFLVIINSLFLSPLNKHWCDQALSVTDIYYPTHFILLVFKFFLCCDYSGT